MGGGADDADRQRALNEALRQRVARSFETSGPQAACWKERQENLARRIRSDSAERFLEWPEIAGSYLLSRRDQEAHDLLLDLERDSGDRDRWSAGLRDSPVGSPRWLPGREGITPNSVLLTTHLARWEKGSGMRVDELDVILEFGGGYGSMCRVAHALGFRGLYVIFDLPVLSALQTYYLRATSLPVFDLQELPAEGSRVACLSSRKDLDRVFAPALPERSLFLATWSLSETPLELRESLHALLDRFAAFLIAYQIAFEDIDNKTYFAGLTAREAIRGRTSWLEERVPHQLLNYYLFGYPSERPVRNMLSLALYERIACRVIRWTSFTRL